MMNDLESEPLLQQKPEGTSKRNKWIYIAGGAFAGAALFSLGVISGAGMVLHSESSDLLSTSFGLDLVSASTSVPGIQVSNKYIAKSESRPQYPWLTEGELKGATILEPFKITSFTALDALASDETSTLSGVSYNWKIERKEADQNEFEIDLQLKRRALLQLKGVNQEEIDEKEPVSELLAESSETSFAHTFDQLGLHRITLEVSYPSTSSVEAQVLSASALVMVKYVRQEIHEVDDEDRVALLSAWQVLMNTNDEDGIAAYGNDFMSFTRLSAEHNNLASDKTCDHLHDGMGFVPAHLSLTRLLEASLQSVTPSVSLPYWEYTIDVEQVVKEHQGDFREWRNIPMFTDKWFGSSDEKTGRLKDSVFVDMDLTPNEFTTTTNGYGLIRSPWNNLKSPSFTRFFGGGSGFNEDPIIFVEKDQMSTCSVLKEALSMKDVTLSSFNGGAAGQVHGPIHMFTGGQSGTKSLTKHMTEIGFHAHGDKYNQYWGDGVTFMFLNIKGLWRYGLWSCSSDCDQTTQQSECACSCNTDDIIASPAYDALFSSYVEEWNDSNGEGGDGMLRGMLDLMCNVFPEDGGVVMGDHASSAAASDPSFWVIHGTVERWLQLMRIQSRFTSESWDSDVFASNIHPDSVTCSGHAETDTLVFGDIDGKTFTNGEYYAYLNPLQPNTPYVYDNFEWSHCDALGYDISTV